MKLCGKLTALLAAAALLLPLAGCQKETPPPAFDAEVYVEGRLAEAYLGEVSQEYLDMVGYNETQVENIYNNSLYLEAQIFAYRYNIEYPQDFYEEIQELYKSVYAHAKFLVVSTSREEDGSISVEVETQPIDLVQKMEEKRKEALKPFFEKYPAGSQNTMDQEAYEAYDAEWARAVIDLLKETLPELGNLGPQRVTVKLTRNEDGYYTLSNEEFQKLNAVIIDYSLPEPEPTPEPTQSPTPPPGESLDPNVPAPPTTASPLPQPEGSEATEESGEPAPEASGTETE